MFKPYVRRVVLLQRYEHFDVISLLYNSTDHGKWFSICFLQ